MFITKKTAAGRVVSKRNAYSGHIFDIWQETVETPDGMQVQRDLVEHAAAVAMLAFTPDQKVLINREYRVGINAEAFALPAGLMNPGEEPVESAKRELEEETGYVAQDMKEMVAIRSSEGMTNETVHLMLVHIDPAKRTEKHFDKDEFVTCQLVPFADVVQAVQDGRIASAQSVGAVAYYLAFEQNK